MEKVAANKEVYTAIAGGSWKKENELRSLKSEAAELDRKIALTLAPPEEEKEVTGDEQNSLSQETKQKPIEKSPSHKEILQSFTHSPSERLESHDVMSRVIISKPKWR